MDGVWRKMVVSGSTLAIISHQSTFRGGTGEFLWIFSPEYPLGGERGNFVTRVSFQGGTGENLFYISFSRDQEEDWLRAWPLIVYILSMEDGLVLL